jgi:hypothetical protein
MLHLNKKTKTAHQLQLKLHVEPQANPDASKEYYVNCRHVAKQNIIKCYKLYIMYSSQTVWVYRYYTSEILSLT